jgi:hypothetical protein
MRVTYTLYVFTEAEKTHTENCPCSLGRMDSVGFLPTSDVAEYTDFRFELGERLGSVGRNPNYVRLDQCN